MQHVNRVEKNVANKAELRANAQNILKQISASRPENTTSVYRPKQEEFKVRNPLASSDAYAPDCCRVAINDVTEKIY